MAEARTWRVHPNPETGEVDETELSKALYEVGVLLRRGGGGVMLLANRLRVPEQPGELPTERYTESVDIQWVARTDTPPRFEETAAAAPAAAEQEAGEPELEAAVAE